MFEHLISKENTFEVTGNKPLKINNNDLCWFVAEGKVDVFAVRLKEGEPYGYKTHTARFEKGALLFGIDNEEIILQALGTPGTKCSELKIKDVYENIEKENLVELVDGWIVKLAYNISKEIKPNDTVKCEVLKEQEVSEKTNFSAKNQVLWVEFLKGKGKLCGEISIGDKLFPVTKDTWIEIVEASKVNTYYTQDIFDRTEFRHYLEVFSRATLNCIKNKIYSFGLKESERLKEKAFKKSKVLNASFEKIKSVLLPAKFRILAEESGSEPLLSVCKIIGNYLKIKVSPHPDDNSKLENIMRASKTKYRKVILKDDWWKHDSGPLLCFTEEDKKPVAVIPKSSKSYELIDLDINKKIKVNNIVAEKLKPFAYSIYRPFPEKEITGWDLFKFGIFHSGSDILMILIMGIAGALLGLLTPIFTGIIFDSIIPSSATNQLFQISYILISCAAATLLFNITKSIATLRIEGKADYYLQSAIWDRLVSLPVPFFRNYSSGDLAMRSMGIDSIRQLLSGTTVQSLLSFIFSVFYFGLLFYYSAELALIATVLGFLLFAATFAIGYTAVKYQQKINDIKNRLAGEILQFLSGIPKLKITGTEVNAFSIWAQGFTEKKEAAKKLRFTQGLMKTFNSMFPVLSLICIFSWVVFGIGDELSTGNFLAFNTAYNSFQNGILQMSMAIVTSLNIIPLYRNLKPILQTLPEVSEAKEHPDVISGDVEVSHLNFRYTSDGPLILKNVSLKVNKDEFVAIVGGSGSGKSTLFRLLLGFEKPEKGSVFYDGKNLDYLDIVEIRKQLGVVLQNAKLFQGSIFDNIVGSLNLTLDDAWKAAKMAGCYEDIKNMPMQMHTVVPAGGENLSGGQRQRIIIARALVKKPRLIYFDEATSALDNRTQSIVSQSLENMNVTRVVIAHRLSTIEHADRIYCLDKGEIVEEGTYDSLMENKGFFYELAKRQIAET